MPLRKIMCIAVVAALGLAAPLPVSARVQDETASSFVIRLGVDVPAGPEEVWQQLVHPEQWWDPKNTYSGDAANLSLEPRAGGCFCEVLPGKDGDKSAPQGSAEHLRVVYAEQPRALRLVGALGPIQPDAVTGVMTMFLQPGKDGTRILWEYAVAGHIRKEGMAAALDVTLTGQILRLGRKLGAQSDPQAKQEGAGEDAARSPDAAPDEAGAGAEGQAEDASVPDEPVKEETQADTVQDDEDAPSPPARDDAKSPIVGR